MNQETYKVKDLKTLISFKQYKIMDLLVLLKDKVVLTFKQLEIVTIWL
jgi:hypothetical protein